MMPTRPAQDAHDAFGMNVHFGFQHPQDTNQFVEPTVDLLLQLGVGRIRQKLYCDANRSRRATREGLRRLMAAGVRLCAPTLVIGDVTSLDAARARVTSYLDEIEGNPDVYDLRLIEAMPGLNEPNGGKRVPEDWARLTRIAQQALFEGVRSRPAFDHVAVQGPPLARPQVAGGPGRPGLPGRRRTPVFAEALAGHASAVGDLSGWADRADVHIYPGDQDSFNGGPPTVFLDAVRVMYAVDRPITVTEYGWANTSPDDPDGERYAGGAKSCPESVTARYAPKAPLNALLLGYQGTYAYEMLENQPPYANDGPAMRQAKFGYVRTLALDPSSWQPKAQFHAMRRFLALFADPGLTFEAQPLAASVRADCPDLRALAFQRRTGEHLLALWRTVDLYQCDRKTNAGRYLEVAPSTVTVTLDRARPVAVHRPSTQDEPVGSGSHPEFTVDVADELVVLVIG